MEGREDLDPYRPTPRVDRGALARGAARTVGVLLGAAISFYGVALYALRCFSTCPSDPAEDATIQLLTVSMILFGIAIVVAAASAATRWSRPALLVVSFLGAVVALCGIVAVAATAAIDARGDHSSYTTSGVVAILVGVACAGAAYALRRRTRS